jgi:rubrerythrin
VSEASQARIARVSGASEAEAARARRYRANVRAEVDMAMIYAALAEYEPDPNLGAICRRLAATEEGHGSF